MKASEAVEQVGQMVFKPGWRMEASDYGCDLVLFIFYIDTVDTSYPDPDGTCRQQITLIHDELFSVDSLDSDGLCAAILRLAAEVDVHENREFLKVRQSDGSWKAPLHPHTPGGQAAWARLGAGRVRV